MSHDKIDVMKMILSYRYTGDWEVVVAGEASLFIHLKPKQNSLKRLSIKPVIQGDFYHWYPQISIPKRKPPSSQSQPFLVTGFPGTTAVIG